MLKKGERKTMKKKMTLVLTSLLMLTALLTTPNFLPSATAPEEPSPGPGGVYHWKIMLAQENVNAWIIGYLTAGDVPIPGTDFFLNCTCELPEPQPRGQFVFWKQNTTVIPTDIHYDKFIDYNKDGIPDEPPITIDGSIPNGDWPEEPHTWYQHVEEGFNEYFQVPWMVVVEVREQPYDEERPFFEWQLTIKSHGISASWSGDLTKNDVILPGTSFYLKTIYRADWVVDMQCLVVRTPYCTVPNDILGAVEFGQTLIPIDEVIHQFPWTKKIVIEPGLVWIDLELTEVQMYNYVVMGGETTSDGQLGTFDAWFMDGVGPVPFATRDPWLTPNVNSQNLTFTQRDPITGVVKIGVPHQSYSGLDHTYWSDRVGTYFRVQILLETQGCGWLFTGVGKKPLLGDVDVITWADNTGVYTIGDDGGIGTGDDVLLSGGIPNVDDPDPPGPATHAYGAGPPLAPCLQDPVFRGPDGIPATGDDALGDGTTDPPGSSILFLPSRMEVTRWDGAFWVPLFGSPWPQLLTTGVAYNTVFEQGSAIDGVEYQEIGYPWEFFAGGTVPWKDSKCNAFVKYACVWSVMEVDTDLGALDVHFLVWEKKVREDVVIADADCNQAVNILDILVAAVAFGSNDEKFGNPIADPNFDARADMDGNGLINILDILAMAVDFGYQITPQCVIRP